MISTVFFGTPSFAIPSLKVLAHDARFHIAAVVTQPDKPQGRSLAVKPSPVAELAARLGLSVIKIESFKNNPDAINRLGSLAPDVAAVVAYGVLLPPQVLHIPKFGVLNLHPSLLPKYRGASPIQTVIRNGDQNSGVTIMLLDEEMDHGPILSQEPITVEEYDTAESLAERLSERGAQLLIETIPQYLEGTIKPREQDHALASNTGQLTKENGKIDWRKPAIEIDRMIRAYYPWPGAWTTFEHKGQVVTLKIIRATPMIATGRDLSLQQVGMVISDCVILCGNYTLLRLDLVQPAGKKPMSGEAFMNGYHKVNRFT